MKRLIALTLVTLGLTLSARAQWLVFDPTAQIQSIINTAQEVAQFVTMIPDLLTQERIGWDFAGLLQFPIEWGGDPNLSAFSGKWIGLAGVARRPRP